MTLDTTAATTDAVDEEANQSCGAPYTSASVWYTFTPATNGGNLVLSLSEAPPPPTVDVGWTRPRRSERTGP